MSSSSHAGECWPAAAQTPLSPFFFDIAKRKCLLMIVKCARGAMPSQDRSCAVSLILI